MVKLNSFSEALIWLLADDKHTVVLDSPFNVSCFINLSREQALTLLSKLIHRGCPMMSYRKKEPNLADCILFYNEVQK